MSVYRTKFGISNFHFYPFPNLHFCQDVQKTCFIIFLSLDSAIIMVHSDILIFNIIRITLNVPSIRILLSTGSLNGKNRLMEGHPRFFSLTFPFENLQIKSIVENSLRPIKSCTQ